MKESRQETLRQNFNFFDFIPGETLEAQLQRFTTLTTEMNIVGIFLTKSEINKRLLNSLPKSWDMNVAVIKKTKDLNRLSIAEVIEELDALKSSVNLPVNEVSCSHSCEVSCSQSCEDTIKFLRDQIDLFKREVEDLRYEGYQLRKGQKPLKAELEAKTKDFRKLQEDYSNKCENYDYIKRQNVELLTKLDTLKGKFETANFDFKKFDVSSELVSNMIDHCLQFKQNQQKGLGYDNVPPPFNHTYQYQPLSKEEIANEPFMVYGKPSGFVSGGFINVENTNVSTSPTDQSLNQSKQAAEESVSDGKVAEDENKE